MIELYVDAVDVTEQILQGSIEVSQKITNQVDNATFSVRKAGTKTLVPEYGQEVEIFDNGVKIFGGVVLSVVGTPVAGADGVQYDATCADHTYTLDRLLASKTYTNTTIEDIIADLISSYAPGFTTVNATSTFPIEKIVFNQIPISTCIKRLAALVNFDWYVDEDKDVHFFDKYTYMAPFDITDDNGNIVYKTLRRNTDGSQVVNRVKVRGGEYDGSTYTDIITVSGSDSKSFKLPYRFANLTIELNTGAGYVSKNVGVDFVDDFTTDDVLYNYNEQMVRWENALTAGNKIRFSGNPKVPVFAIAEDADSIAAYGKIEKLIRDASIESNTLGRQRATAELYANAEPVIDAKFRTYTSGLRAGMILNIQSDIQGHDDQLIIKNLTFRMRDHETFYYEAQLVSTKRYDFINLLQKLIEPEPTPDDEREVSEEIFTDTQNISITEEIEFVVSVNDEETITTQELYTLNPLGAGVDAEYVLSEYTPTGVTDTKRPGRLGISLVAY